MQRYKATLSSKGQVTVPARVRHILGVSAHDPIMFVINDDRTVSIEQSRELTLEELEGILPPLNRPTSPDFSVEIREAMDERADEIVRRMGGL